MSNFENKVGGDVNHEEGCLKKDDKVEGSEKALKNNLEVGTNDVGLSNASLMTLVKGV